MCIKPFPCIVMVSHQESDLCSTAFQFLKGRAPECHYLDTHDGVGMVQITHEYDVPDLVFNNDVAHEIDELLTIVKLFDRRMNVPY